MNSDLSSAQIYNDLAGLSQLKYKAANDSASAIKETARQFESLFIHMMVKSMRDSVQKSELFDQDKMDFYNDMYDQQISVHLAEKGIGLAPIIERQLSGQSMIDKPEGDIYSSMQSYFENSIHSISAPIQNQLSEKLDELQLRQDFNPKSAKEFVNELLPYARQAAEELGVDPKLLLAQAALETGWGKAMIRDNEGQNSFNLFGIKADVRWDGSQVKVSTLEFEDGVALRKREPFRSYASPEDAFKDYVAFIKGSPRYQNAVANAGSPQAYLQGLKEGGYATDPAYVEKIWSIFQGDTLNDAIESIKELRG